MSQPAIRISNLSKTYGTKGGIAAVRNLSLEVAAGEIYGFLGANGAGKTTTIKILLGLQFAEQGSAEVLGGDPTSNEVKQRVGYLPERPYFHESMKLDEFFDFHRALFGRFDSRTKPLMNEELAAMVGLEGARQKRLKEFSKGMLQRAGIAQALVNDPGLVILDEPMSGLDPVGRREIRDLILRLGVEGRTIFLSSHILSDVEQICHRIAFLEKGELRREGRVEDLLRGEETGFEITLAGEGLDGLFARNARSSGRGLIITCANSGEARSIIQKGWEAGASLVSCHPIQRDLEEVLFGKGRAQV